jgi:hypothetical protein
MQQGGGRRRCAFQLLRYVPDAVRNEYVHIGVVLREEGSEEPALVRFTRDWRRVRCLDPDADTALLEGMESELRRSWLTEPEGAWKRRMEEALSLSVQMTAPKAYLAESMPAGMEELMRLYVEPLKREKLPRLSGRAAIQARMRSEFERVGVWDLLRKRIPAAEYTRAGDPLRLDAGYRPNGVIRVFHAVSLEAGAEMAKVLAFSSTALHAGVQRVEGAQLELTAIVEPAARLGATDEEPERLALYRFGVETMEEHRIRVLTASAMDRVAERARRELLG